MAESRDPLVYHITEMDALTCQLGFPLDSSSEKLYFPAAFEQDGFVHDILTSSYSACSEGNELIPIGNHFYKSSKGKWVCLEIDTRLLDSETKYEPPAPVADRASHHAPGEKLYPHCYGGISAKAIVRVLDVERGSDGSFLRIEGI